MHNMHADEPCTEDKLERSKFVAALAETIEKCHTPLAIGLYGSWGSGKTSLMRMIEARLKNGEKVFPVWFDAWQHQFDENPSLALLHTMVQELKLGEEAKKLLLVIASAFGTMLLRATTALGTSEIKAIAEQYEEERFLIREKQVRLHQHFKELIQKATGPNMRLAFLIDDLDRCVPDQVLRTLEAIKLYLNMPNCVYVLGVDRSALETSIRYKYQGAEVSEAMYLDKIVQLPFTIPPVTPKRMIDYIKTLLPAELMAAAEQMLDGVASNPRQAKRFANALILNDALAREMFSAEHDVNLLVQILFVQIKYPELFKELIRDPAMEIDKWVDQLDLGGNIGKKEALHTLAKQIEPKPKELIARYVYLSEAASARKVSFAVVISKVPEEKRIEAVGIVREILKISLTEASEMLKSLPKVVLSNIDRQAAESVVNRLAAVSVEAAVK